MQLDTFSEDKCLAKASVVKMPPPDGSEATPPATSGTSATTSTTFSCNVSLPPKLQLQSGNLSKEWKQWRQIWDAYEEVTDLRNKTSRLRVATFITCIGKEALEVHNGLPFQSDDEKTEHMVELNSDWLIMTADISSHPSLFQEGKLITGCKQHY